MSTTFNLKKQLTLLAGVLALLLPSIASANIATPWYATSTTPGSIQPTLINGYNPWITVNGILSTASSTFSSSLFLTALGAGTANIGLTGNVYTSGTTTASCSGSASCTPFTIFGSSPITISDSGSGTNYLTNSGVNTYLNTGTNLQAPVLMATSTATSTFAGPVQIGGGSLQDNLLQLNCNQTYSNSASTGGCVNINNTNNGREGLVLYEGTGANLAPPYLFREQNASTTLTSQMFTIVNASTQAASTDIQLEGAGYAALGFQDTTQSNTTGQGKFQLDSHNAVFRMESRNYADNSYQVQALFAPVTNGNQVVFGGQGDIFSAPANDAQFNIVQSTTTLPYLYVSGTTTPTTSQGNILALLENGYLGIGTSTPGTILSIGSTTANSINLSNIATSTFGSGLNLLTGCYAINGTCLSTSSGGNSFGYPFPSNATSTLLNFNGGASTTELTTTGSTYLSTLSGGVAIGEASNQTGDELEVAGNTGIVNGNFTEYSNGITNQYFGISADGTNGFEAYGYNPVGDFTSVELDGSPLNLDTRALGTVNIGSKTFASNLNVFGTASTSALTISNLTGTQCLQEIAGVVSGTGSGCGSGGNSFSYLFTNPSEYGTTTAATTTPFWAQGGIFASSTSQIASTTFSNGGNVTINNNVTTTVGNTPAFPELTLNSNLNTYEAPSTGVLNLTDSAPDAKANIAFQVVSTSSPNTPVTKAWLNAPNLLLNWNVASFAPSAVNTTTGVFAAANNYGAGQSPNITAGYFTSTGTLPTGISASTYYYAAGNSSNEGTSFTVYLTAANAESLTSPVIPSTQGTGTITFTPDETYAGNQEYQFQIETTDETKTNLHGRFLVPFDQNTTPITLANANLFIAHDSGFTDGNESLQSQLCIGTPQCYGETMLGDAGNGWSNYYNTPFLISNTLNPQTDLATTSNYSEILQANTTTVGAGTGLGFMETTGTTGSSIGSSIVSYRDGSGGYSDLAFNTQNNSGNVLEGMRLTSTGNLGVGTTSPYARLSVEGNASDGNADTNLFSVAYAGSSATTTNFTVLQNGNIGIGTTTPGVPLAIAFNQQNPASMAKQNIIEVSSTTAAGATTNLLQFNSMGDLTLGNINNPSWTDTPTTGHLAVNGQAEFNQNVFFTLAGSGLNWGSVGSFNPAIRGGSAANIIFAPATSVSGSAPYMYYTPAADLGIGSSSPDALLSVQADSNQSVLAPYLFMLGSSTAAFATSTIFSISPTGHIVEGGPLPTVSGGTSSMVANSSDASGQINVAGTALTSVTMTFANPWKSAPNCTESDNQTASVGDITSISTTQIVFSFSVGISTAQLWYICSANQ